MSKLLARLEPISAPIQSALENFLNGLSDKDKRALSLLLLIGVPVLVIWGLLLPAHKARLSARAEHQDAMALISQIRQEAPRLQGLSGARISAAELPQRVQTLATTQGIALERLESDPSGLRLAINNANITTVVTFLQQCRAQGIKVIEAQITRDEKGGASQVRLRLGA